MDFPDTVITKMRFHFVGAHNPSSQIYGIGGAASPFRILHQAMFGISLLLGDSAVWLVPFLGLNCNPRFHTCYPG